MNEYIKKIEEIAAKCTLSQSDGYSLIMRICEAIKEEQQLNKYEEIKEIVNRQLIAGKNNYKETYECFWEIAKIVVN